MKNSIVQVMRNKHRSPEGSTLVLIAAITMGLIMTLIFFCLNYTRLLGSNSEQKKAIESAALAAATDLSTIVIPTAEFGYVSLSDQAPIGKATAAGDQYYLPVRGVNTLIGTVRADAIVATELNKIDSSPVWMELVKLDRDNTISVINQLTTVLQDALTQKGSKLAKDRDNNPLNVYQDAENAYTQNIIRMSGSSNYVDKSMMLTLGELSQPSDTNITVPEPAGSYPVDPTLQQNGQYKSYVNIPLDTPTGKMDFVFGGIGSTNRLVDEKIFVKSATGLPYHVPTIVKAEADQVIRTSQTPSGATFHSVACAQPSSVFDVRPAPGAIAIEFPDGPVPTLTKPSSLLTSAYLNTGTDCDNLTAVKDYPKDIGSYLDDSCTCWPSTVSQFKIADAWRITLYDWIRRGGVKANIADIVNAQSMAFNAPAPATVHWITELSTTPLTNTDLSAPPVSGPQIPYGIMHIYKFDNTGHVAYKSQPVAPYPYEVVGDQQLYAEKLGSDNGPPSQTDFVLSTSQLPTLTFANVTLPGIGNGGGGKGAGKPGGKGKGKTITGGSIIFTQAIDTYVRDQCRLLSAGTGSAPKHGGEPLNDTLVAMQRNVGSQIAVAMRPGDFGAGGCGSGGPPPGVKGGGANPLLGAQSDFGDNVAPPEPTLSFQNAGTPGVRPTYETTGLTGSIRFRRQVQVTGSVLDALTGILGTKTDVGYVGAKYAGFKTYSTPTSDTTTVTDDLFDK
jgi:hypothetical protein